MGKKPQATFSTCFGAPFLPRRPEIYGKLLSDLIDRHGADCWLVNTGWTGGAYGTGKRMSIQHTRALLRAALDGSLAQAEFTTDPFFGLQIPKALPGVPAEVLNPRETWADKSAYDRTAKTLMKRFEKNFESFSGGVSEAVLAAAIRAAA
jgi:phosphoenolpyruvate carboxykinase (ATP)